MAQVEWLGSYVWTSDDPRFGGFSGFEMSGDGESFIALSDRGYLASGTLVRSGGSISSIKLEALSALTGPDGAELPRALRDSEGLASDPHGVVVSYEWTHGIRRFDHGATRGGPLLSDPTFDDLQSNASLEAVAIDADGAVYAIPERSGLAGQPFPVFQLSDGSWNLSFTIPRRGAFLVAGADIGPDNRLYVLERDFLGIGFRSRIRRFDLDGGRETTLLATSVLTHDNLEGISVWEDGLGLRLSMISDDNYRIFQRTEIVEYRLTAD